jgi:DNA-dependent RNA polymerase auxiliary subunit epsilon
MNFRVNIGNVESTTSFGEIIHNTNGIQIESDFQQVSTYASSAGMLFCLGVVKNKDKTKSVDVLFDEMDRQSLHSIVKKLEGRFALFFVENDGLYASSDQFGKLDIYYQQNKDNIVLASSLDLLPENPAKDGFNQAALIHTLTYYGYCPPKKDTLYNSVKRLDVDECIYIQDNKLRLVERTFVAQSAQEYTDSEHDNYTDIFLTHLQETASKEGNLVYLSSGWDSTSILAGLIHLFGKNKVSGLIGRMKYSDRSGCCNQIEIDKARKIARYYDIKLEIVDFDLTDKNKDYFDLLRVKMRKHQLYAMTGITHDKLAIKASDLPESNKTIFAGEISDGAHNLGFSQYATIFHPSHGFREYSDKMASYLFGPTFLSLLISGEYIEDPIYRLFKERTGGVIFDEIAKTPEEIKLQLLTSLFLRNARLPLWSLDNEILLTPKGRKHYTQKMQEKYLVDIAKNMDVDNVYASYLYLYNRFHWQGSTVRSLQIMADYYQLNTDLPFWNSGLQDFLAKMPEDWGRGLDLNPTKYPLKKMLKDKIDYPYDYQKGAHSYTYDVDHSFSHAQEVYCYSALVEDFQNSLKNKPYRQILSKDYFDLDYIDVLVDEYICYPKDMSVVNLTKLAPIIMLCYVGWYGKQ